MTTAFNPFESKSGFKSPGFEVTNTGAIDAVSIDVATLILNGVPYGQTGGGGGIGGLNVDVEGDFRVLEASTPYLAVINGKVSILSRNDDVGTIDNVDIGSITPGTGTFTEITAVSLGVPKFESSTNLVLSAGNMIVLQLEGSIRGRISASGIDIPVVDTTINNTIIGGTTPAAGTFTEVNITNDPITPTEATTKGYVDRRIAAFSIAFGA
jgi:hypothetical protein